MPYDYETQALAYMGVEGGKYAIADDTGDYGTPVALKNLKSIPINVEASDTPIYSDNIMKKNLRTDNGYKGSIGVSAQDRAFEKALGFAMDGAGGLMQVSGTGYKKVAFYFESKEEADFGSYTVKCWLLNCEVGKANRAHNTNTNAPAMGEYSYPLTVKGEKVMNAAGTAEYTDAAGNTQVCTLYIAVPGDTGYDTFGASVPEPKVPTNP